MNQEKDIQDLFSRLQNQSSPVRPELWQKIQSSAGLAGGATSGAAAAGGVSIAGKLFIAAAFVAALGTSVYLFTKSPENQEVSVLSEPKNEKNQNEGQTETKEVSVPEIENAETPQKTEQVTDKKEAAAENELISSPGHDSNKTLENPLAEPEKPGSETIDKEEVAISEDTEEPIAQKEIELHILSHQEEGDPLDWFFTVEGPDAASYYWTFTDGYSVSGTRVRHRFMSDGTYGVCVNVIASGYQTGKECIDVEALRKITVIMPNVFSPGSSPGINDLYDIDHANSENILNYRLLIYDTRGTLIFESTDVQKPWDGNDRFGQAMPTGTYICVVEAQGYAGQKSTSRHSLTLKR